MNVLVDTSVWVDHFRSGNARLVRLLESDMVLVHPMVIAEIACGTPPEPRAQTLASLRMLRSSNQAALTEIMDFIEKEKLYGQGCGLVDIALLASALITPGARLWTLDKRLDLLTHRFRIAFVAA
jgi:predicted nucleic acid-binding protein